MGEGKSIVKLFLTFCKTHRGFTRQPESPNVHSWNQRFKHHQNSTKQPPREARMNENCGGRGKKGRRLVSRRVGALKGREGANFAPFFFTPATFFFSFFLLWGILVEFGWSFLRPQMCTFGFLGLSCEASVAPKPPGNKRGF